MKRETTFHRSLRVAFLMAALTMAYGTARAQTVVTFPDPNLEAVVREAIGKPTGDILDTDLLSMTVLVAWVRGIADLTGLEYATNLTELILHENQIIDVSPLSGLTSLAKLWLGVNQIIDVSPLAALTSLTELVLNYRQANVHWAITLLSRWRPQPNRHCEEARRGNLRP